MGNGGKKGRKINGKGVTEKEWDNYKKGLKEEEVDMR